MKINVKGKNDKLTNTETKKIVYVVISNLISDRLKQNIEINIEYKVLPRTIKGSTIWVDRNYRPREFLVEINSTYSKKSQIETLAHELVHVKQFAKGELRCLVRPESNLYWFSEKYKPLANAEKYSDYCLLPWEIEANGMTEGLVAKYYESIGAYKRKK